MSVCIHQFYQWAGCTLVSEIELPELTPLEGRGQPENAEISVSLVARRPEDRKSDDRATCSYPNYSIGSEQQLVYVTPHGGTFEIYRDGRILVFDHETVEIDLLRGQIVGPCLGALCYLWGWLPVHAAAVATSQAAVLLAADSGVGKSTMTAFLARRGLELICDDLSVLRPTATGELALYPTVPTIKLKADGLAALGSSAMTDKFSVIGAYGIKTVLRYHSDTTKTSWPVDELLILTRNSNSECSKASLVPLRGSQIAAALMRVAYRPFVATIVGTNLAHLRLNLQLVERIVAHELHYREGLEHIDGVIEFMLEHWNDRARVRQRQKQPVSASKGISP